MNINETIAAISTGLGGAVAIIRISGDDALDIANSIWKSETILSINNARSLILGRTLCRGTDTGDPAMAVFMPGPKSYTGEDVVEIQCHGGTLVARKVLESALAEGAKAAEAGEFTYRAFMNNKLDLTQAEAVADIISAHSDMALNLAERQSSGILGRTVSKIRTRMVDVLSECESRLDFGEEDLEWTDPDKLLEKIRSSLPDINRLMDSGNEGNILRNGIRIVIAGKPNAGKSSLLNLLLGYDRAIVTTVPGTTRDTLEEFATLRHIPVKLIDTAGIREADNIIEGMGIERSFASIKQAQLILWLLDASGDDIRGEAETYNEHVGQNMNSIPIWNKTDLNTDTGFLQKLSPEAIMLSVEKQEGVETLLDRIEESVWEYPHTEEPEIAVNSRHFKLLDEARDSLPEACLNIKDENWELASLSLRTAITALGTITGENADPDILDEIFSRFCIGK